MLDRLYPPAHLRALYPESDGRTTGEHSMSCDWLFGLFRNFRILFEDRDDVSVHARMFWYPVEGRSDVRHAPHLMVDFGRPKLNRTAYLQWMEEGVAPQVVFEIDPRLETEGTEDAIFEFYNRYGVEEYYRIDWMFGEFLGWKRSASGQLVEIPEMNGWISPRMGIHFEVCNEEIYLLEPTGKYIISPADGLHAPGRVRAARPSIIANNYESTVELGQPIPDNRQWRRIVAFMRERKDMAAERDIIVAQSVRLSAECELLRAERERLKDQTKSAAREQKARANRLAARRRELRDVEPPKTSRREQARRLKEEKRIAEERKRLEDRDRIRAEAEGLMRTHPALRQLAIEYYSSPLDEPEQHPADQSDLSE